MSVTDFDQCTPDEFERITRHWEERHTKESWEIARFLACSMLQPWSKKALKVTDVCRFAWDEVKKTDGHPHEESTRERFEELMRRRRKG